MELKLTDIDRAGESVRKVLSGACSEMVAMIRDRAGKTPHEVVHELRKQMKKMRAVLRLVRDDTGDYKEWNRFFRDLARTISDVRDAQAHLEALDLLYAQYGENLYKNALDHVRDVLLEHRQELSRKVLQQDEALDHILAELESRCTGLNNLSLEDPGPELLAKGVRRTYKRGRKAYRISLEAQEPENLHEWRKRVKYLRYELLAIQDVWPAWATTWEDELHRLSDFLGTDRDLFELQEVMEGMGLAKSGEADCQLVLGLTGRHREEMQQHALLLGARLYSQQPAAFRGLIRDAYDASLREKDLAISPAESLER